MPIYRVEIEGERKPWVCIDFEQDAEPTDEQIDAQLCELAEGVLNMESYLAEFIVDSGYHVNGIEKYG